MLDRFPIEPMETHAPASDLTRRKFLTQVSSATAGAVGSILLSSAGCSAPESPQEQMQEPRKPLTFAEIVNHLQETMELVSIESLLSGKKPMECVDGRRKEAHILGTPGGAMGEIAVSLTVLHRLGIPVTAKTVEAVMEAYAETTGVYAHTDSHAQKSGALGCKYLDFLRRYPDEYGLPTETHEHMLTTFFRHLKENDARFRYEILEGEHGEEGLVIARGLDDTLPALTPCGEDNHQFFVYHPQAWQFVARRLADRLREIAQLPASRRSEVLEATESVQAQHFKAAGLRLAAKKPVYYANLTESGILDVQRGPLVHEL